MDLSLQESVRAKQLHGRRLLCEIPFSKSDVDQLRINLLPMGHKAWDFPTLASVMTVGVGVYYYNQGDFWSEFPGFDSQGSRVKWGQSFENFISSHGSLETFRAIRAEGGHRYVGPILAHGGIPQTCLADFFSLVTINGDREQSGTDLIDIFKSSPNKLLYVDQPVQRFFKYGGEISEDFVARFLALWQCYERGDMGAKCSLPERVVKEFHEWWPNNRPRKRNNIKRKPKPELRIEPAGIGIYLYLPRCDDHPDIEADASWRFLERDWATTRSHEIRLMPSIKWTISGIGNTTINGLTDESHVLFFDPKNGKAISDPGLRRLPEKVWCIYRKGTVTDPPPIFEEDFLQWPGFCFAGFNLTNKYLINIGRDVFEIRRLFFSCEDDPIVQNVRTHDRKVVFYAAPKIDWEGMANLSLTQNGEPLGNIDIEAKDLSVLLDKPGDYFIELRGPLGENVHKHFTLIPGLVVEPAPLIMWPNQKSIKWQINADGARIKCGNASLPLTRLGPRIEFKVEYIDCNFTLNARVPELYWRFISQQVEKITEPTNSPLTLSINTLYEENYPIFECTFGSLGDDIEVFLIAIHSEYQLQGNKQRTGNGNCWYFDLRPVRDLLESTGKSEEFNLLVKSENVEFYCGKVLCVLPHWSAQNFSAFWKKDSNEHLIKVSWQEMGRPVEGRWLVLISVWRPLEDIALKHNFKETERSGLEWKVPLEDLKPGRYKIKAVHAPWGCNDWVEAYSLYEQSIDIYPGAWPKCFGINKALSSVNSYLESLLAHWYRPELVPDPPSTPTGLTATEIREFLYRLRAADILDNIKIPRDESGSLNIFCENPIATTEAYRLLEGEKIAEIWVRVLPSLEIIDLDLNEKDKEFLAEVAFQYTNLETAADSIRFKYKQKYLSEALAIWHKNLKKEKPPVDLVIFLCEKFKILETQRAGWRSEYRHLKSTYQSREAV